MAANSIPIGSPLAAKVFSAGLFTKVQQAPGFLNMLSGPMPKNAEFGSKAKDQTAPGYPVVKAGDLSKGAGDRVSIDLFNPLRGKPVMGDTRVQGKMMKTSSSSMDIWINQTRAGADNGGKMSQKRTVHNLRDVVMTGLTDYMGRLEDQRTLVQLAGARGTQNHSDWVVPQDSDEDFNGIMVNDVQAPTKNRQFYAGDATSVEELATTDAMTFTDIERVASQIRESTIPLQGIKYENDDKYWNSPLYVWFVSERQFLYLKSRATNTQWTKAVADAVARKVPGAKHPLFDNMETIMWGGMLIATLKRYAIRFDVGSKVQVDQGTGGRFTPVEKTAAVPTDRSIIVGAQALGRAYGRSGGESAYFYDWSEEQTDHKNVIEIVASDMGGTAKIRFEIDGVPTDHGCAVFDSYAPAIESAEGRALLAS